MSHSSKGLEGHICLTTVMSWWHDLEYHLRANKHGSGHW